MIPLMLQFALTVIASAIVITLAVNLAFNQGEKLIEKRRERTGAKRS